MVDEGRHERATAPKKSGFVSSDLRADSLPAARSPRGGCDGQKREVRTNRMILQCALGVYTPGLHPRCTGGLYREGLHPGCTAPVYTRGLHPRCTGALYRGCVDRGCRRGRAHAEPEGTVGTVASVITKALVVLTLPFGVQLPGATARYSGPAGPNAPAGPAAPTAPIAPVAPPGGGSARAGFAGQNRFSDPWSYPRTAKRS